MSSELPKVPLFATLNMIFSVNMVIFPMTLLMSK